MKQRPIHGVRDALVFVEGGVGECDTVPAKFKAAVRKGAAGDVFVHQVPRDPVLNQDDPLPLKREGQLFAELAFLASAASMSENPASLNSLINEPAICGLPVQRDLGLRVVLHGISTFNSFMDAQTGY